MIDGEIFEMYLGLPRQGKTLTMNEKNILPALIADVNVYCDYWVNWRKSNYHHFTEMDEVYGIRNAVIGFDEIAKLLEPRAWDKEDSGIRHLFQLRGHRHLDIFGTTQHVSLIAKTALIEVSRFYMCTRRWNGDILKLIWPNFPWVCVNVEEMELADIKLLDVPVFRNITDEPEDFEDIDYFSMMNHRTYNYNVKKLRHRELDKYKQELIHTYCPECKGRQGKQISAEDTYKFAYYHKKKKAWLPFDNLKLDYCPKHPKVRLQIMESGMYDSWYEYDIKPKIITFKPYVKTVVDAPFRGSLSPELIAEKKELIEKYNK